METEKQKLTGSYYTESKIAEFAANWAIRGGADAVLEPSFGEGIFIDKALERFAELGAEEPSVVAVEVQPEISERVGRQFESRGVNIISADYLSTGFKQQFDATIGNPPYVGLRNLTPEQVWSARVVINKHGAPCPNNGSLWFPFVLHAIDSTKKGGRLAFVLPFEITYAKYSHGLWEILARNFEKLSIYRIYEDFFPNVDVETVLLLTDCRGGSTNRVDYNTYDTVEALLDNKATASMSVNVADITAGRKPFVSALLTTEQRQLIKKAKETNLLQPIIDTCKFKIGYVSADKVYFHPTEETISHYSIPRENIHPTILNAKEINGSTGIGIEVMSGDCQSGLYVPGRITEGDRLYIQSGEMLGVNQRYKCRRRKPWYVTPNIEVPDVILSVFGETPKIVANKGRYAISNSLLCGHLKGGANAESLLCRWYNSLTLLSLEMNVHSLGGGSFVVIPGEADRLDIVKGIPKEDVQRVYRALDDAIKEKGTEAAYELGDEIVLKGIFGMHEQDIATIREAIKTLRKWRNPQNRRTLG